MVNMVNLVNLFDEAEKRGERALVSILPCFAPSQINSIFTINRPILYLFAIHDVLKIILNHKRIFIMHYLNGILTIWRSKIPDVVFTDKNSRTNTFSNGSGIIFI